MSDKKYFYITTTLPYVNAKPHVGFALEIIRADAIARFQRKIGKQVFFNTGTDEHGSKIEQKAEDLDMAPQDFVDSISAEFVRLKDTLNISSDAFIRTTDAHHMHAAQEFWIRCQKAGYIEKKTYTGIYCKGCEMFKTDRDLVNGACPDHPMTPLEEVSEENYFFLFSKFSDTLLEIYEQDDFVIPDFRLNEIRNQIKNGLEDFSISRMREKVSWGVEVPGDPEQVMYVWFDALVNYISTLGWPDNLEKFDTFWNPEVSTIVQVCGKDNLQQQSARWQAMLASVGLPQSSHIIVNGFITVDGQKMSKSLGNVIDPFDLVTQYGVDALRYFVLRELNPYEDSDFNTERFKETYNANLANGIGNLTNRIMKMAEDAVTPEDIHLGDTLPVEYLEAMNVFDVHEASQVVWQHVGDLDKKIQETEPFKLIKSDPEAGKKILIELVEKLHTIAHMLEPLLPETSARIFKAIVSHKKPEEPLFVRL